MYGDLIKGHTRVLLKYTWNLKDTEDKDFNVVLTYGLAS
jgi:hypothetical protein